MNNTCSTGNLEHPHNQPCNENPQKVTIASITKALGTVPLGREIAQIVSGAFAENNVKGYKALTELLTQVPANDERFEEAA